ncbi:Hypothetical predicted protein [Pelobates cultripes]|uniref:Uncharacterized protein n=1 Tax=Pelobates cultripes TaxID=61616 RepID=A0AAD1R8L1_PELCU|nr:Hypothetical predicted protein [Pelobates cultripes]
MKARGVQELEPGRDGRSPGSPAGVWRPPPLWTGGSSRSAHTHATTVTPRGLKNTTLLWNTLRRHSPRWPPHASHMCDLPQEKPSNAIGSPQGCAGGLH